MTAVTPVRENSTPMRHGSLPMECLITLHLRKRLMWDVKRRSPFAPLPPQRLVGRSYSLVRCATSCCPGSVTYEFCVRAGGGTPRGVDEVRMVEPPHAADRDDQAPTSRVSDDEVHAGRMRGMGRGLSPGRPRRGRGAAARPNGPADRRAPRAHGRARSGRSTQRLLSPPPSWATSSWLCRAPGPSARSGCCGPMHGAPRTSTA